MSANRIAIVEDEDDLRNLLKLHLEREGYEVLLFSNGDNFLDFAGKNRVGLVILDLMMPGTNGLDVCRILRADEQNKDVPIIILTAKSTEADIVVGLELGADDYITKPFSMRELQARVKAIFRRVTKTESENTLMNGAVTAYVDRFHVYVESEQVQLTATEFSILVFLLRRKGRVLTRNQILDSLGGDRQYVIDRTVDVHILNIRKKLGDAGKMIETIRGIGYRIEEE
jgi:DNA-binding response OmpR family regulator